MKIRTILYALILVFGVNSAVGQDGLRVPGPPTGTSGHTVPYLDGTNTWSAANAFGILTGTSLALGGCTIGTDAFCVTGTSTIGGNLTINANGRVTTSSASTGGIGNTNSFVTFDQLAGGALGASTNFYFSGSVRSAITASGYANASGGYLAWGPNSTVNATNDTTITRSAAGVVQIGTTAANANGSLLASAGTFSGILSSSSTTDSTTTTTGALQSAGGLAVLKRVFFGGLTASSGLQTAVLCLSAGNEVIADSVACLASSEAFKENIAPSDMGLDTVMALKPIVYKYKATGNERFDNAPNQRAIHAGFSAEQAATVDTRLIAYDAEGKIRTVRPDAVPAALVLAVQQQQAVIDALRSRLETLEKR